MFAILLVLIVLVLGVVKWWQLNRYPCDNFPPGPLGLPLVGYLPALTAKDLTLGLAGIHKAYGKVISVNLGPSRRIISIGDFNILKECFKDNTTTLRPEEMLWPMKYFRFGNGKDSRGLLFSANEEWMEQRRFTLRNLRDFGFGKSGMEGMIMEEVNDLLSDMDTEAGSDRGVRILGKFNISVVNALWTIMTGKRHSLHDAEFLKIVDKIEKLTALSNTDLVNVFPFLRHIIPYLSGWNDVLSRINPVIEYIDDTLSDHTKRHKAGDAPQDLIDVFLDKIDESAGAKNSFTGKLGYQNLRSNLLDLLFAGSETTSNTLSWGIVVLINHPEIQEKAQQELDEVLGGRPPSMEDKPNMPYFEALLEELLRFSLVAPLAVPHSNSTDIEVEGYRIPKGSFIFPNIYEITRCEADFPEPNTFKPERFLDKEGKFQPNEKSVVFGIGKRDCLGKTLAKVELFLFFASLVQRYNFTTGNDNGEVPSLKPIFGFTRIPEPFKAKFVIRGKKRSN